MVGDRTKPSQIRLLAAEETEGTAEPSLFMAVTGRRAGLSDTGAGFQASWDSFRLDLHSTPSQASADPLTLPADRSLHLGLGALPAWPGRPLGVRGPASRPHGERDRRCHCWWPSLGAFSWPKRDRYNSVLASSFIVVWSIGAMKLSSLLRT